MFRLQIGISRSANLVFTPHTLRSDRRAVTRGRGGLGNLQAIYVQLLAGSEVPALGNTGRSRVEARAADDRHLPRSGLAHAVEMHRASGEPGDEVDPDLLVRHREDHVAVS